MSSKEEKTARNIVERPARNGGRLRTGNPGNKGGSGRPPNEFKAHMAALVSRKDVEAYFERCLSGEFGPKFFLAARQAAKDDAYGKAAQPIVGDAEQPVEIVVKYAK